MSVHVSIQSASPEDVRRWLRDEEDLFLSDLPSFRELQLERDWDAIHYLLTGSVEPVRGSLSFLKSGGKDVNQGGNERLFRPPAVRRIHTALSGLSMKVCRQRFKPKKMEELEIYLGSWDFDPPNEGILFDLIKDLKSFVRQANNQGDCLVYSDDA
jgi:hypothetical protein